MRNNTRIIVDFEKAILEKDEDNNVQLRAGDNIIIPVKPNTVFVTGRSK